MLTLDCSDMLFTGSGEAFNVRDQTYTPDLDASILTFVHRSEPSSNQYRPTHGLAQELPFA
jgi:hypothetical protein